MLPNGQNNKKSNSAKPAASAAAVASVASVASATTTNIAKIVEFVNKLVVNKYFKLFLAVLFNLFLFFILSYSSSFAANDHSFKFFYLQIAFIILFLFILFFIVGKLPFNSVLIYGIFGIVLAILLFTNTTINGMIFSTYVSSIVFFVIITLGLAITYNVLVNNIRRIAGWKGFIINLIFLIPCLISESIEWLFSEFGATPNIVFVLFVLEIVFVLLYIYLPDLKKQMIKDDGIDLLANDIKLSNPALLNQHTYLDKKKILIITPQPDNPDDPIVISNYTSFAFSMWIYVNPVGNHYYSYKFETPIFNYKGHPKITYMNDPDTTNSDVYKIYFKNETDVDKVSANVTTITLPGQRWNFLVFNYTPNTADVFVNGVLERSTEFKHGTPDYDPNKDTITIGSDSSVYTKLNTTAGPDYGLDGAIANVMFYPHILTKSQIANRYNLTMPNPNGLSNYPVFTPKKDNISTPK